MRQDPSERERSHTDDTKPERRDRRSVGHGYTFMAIGEHSKGGEADSGSAHRRLKGAFADLEHMERMG